MITDEEIFVKHYLTTLSIHMTAKALGLSYYAGRKLFHAAVESGALIKPPHASRKGGQATHVEIKKQPDPEPVIGGRLHARVTPKAHRTGKITRFIATCLQNNTHVHEPFWENLQAMAKAYDARIIIARTVYNLFSEASSMDKKIIIGDANRSLSRNYTWDSRMEPFFVDERLQLAPGLVWCGETNILPTAATPLAGFDSYTGRASSIIPHNKIAMRSVATHPSEGTKVLYTTGTLSLRNYIQRKAGQLAEFHHCYGALLIEVDCEGTWFVRQINADVMGVIHDWDMKVESGIVTYGNPLLAINWGDIHVAYGDKIAYDLAFGKGEMLDQLRPEYQFIHDLIDFRTRNPHTIKKHQNLQAFVEYTLGHRSVSKEMNDVAMFLARTLRDDMKTIVVSSNHDNFLVHWLERYGDFRKDPENAVYFLKAASHLWEQTEGTGKPPNMTEWAMLSAEAVGELLDAHKEENLHFLNEDESLILNDIEFGMHGHQGANGSRGTSVGLSKMGRKANIGHHHSAGIYDGLYVSGILGSLDQGYNSGPGSWTQSNILTYATGKRAIQTIYDGKIRAI